MGINNTPCPCGSGNYYPACCGVYLDGAMKPTTAEQLMRSRYCAFVMRREDYLLATWHATTRPHALHLLHEKQPQWLGLTVIRAQAGSAKDNEGVVEFVVRYRINGMAMRLHEVSRFVRESNWWYYVDGVIVH